MSTSDLAVTAVAAEAPSKFTITDQLCACGCETRLNSDLVSRGKNFIWGHKGGAGKIHNKVAVKQPAPRPGPVHSTSMSDVLRFLKEQERVLSEQERAVREALKPMQSRLDQLADQRQRITDALDKLVAVPAWRLL